MTAVEKYNALNGRTVTREELKEIMVLGEIQGQIFIVEKIKTVLDEFEDSEFQITVGETVVDRLPEDCLNGLECIIPDEEFEGLEKAVSPDEIYQMITDKMIAQLKEATGTGYKKKWKKQNEEGYLIPFNFDSKKQYRGINIALLTDGMSKVMKNPFFLTFKQIEKFKGKLKKGSKGLPVVYFTMLYAVNETNENGDKIEFGTYNKAKYIAWLTKNIGRLKNDLSYYKNQYIPILKYYNVFNGADVEGIDFKLEDFTIGYQDGSQTVKNNDHRVQIADLIVKHYPTPKPVLKDSKDGRAYYKFGFTSDEIHMPKIEDFETSLDYYRTLLHEFTHSTGIPTRLNRPMGGKFGSPQYAKEELVAEFGAVFLSAHAGIIWYNQSNHAEYLKNWNNVLTYAKDDNRFIMRAASKAQEAADFVLNLDKEGVPAYQKEFQSAVASKTALLAKETKKPKDVAVLKSEDSKKSAPNTNQLLADQKKAKIQAKTKVEFEKGLQKLGFEIIESDSDYINPKKWERTYKLNYKNVAGVDLKLKVKPEGKEFEGDYSWEAIGIDAGSLIDYKNLQEFYEEILNDLKQTFNFTIDEADDLRKQFGKTLYKKKEPVAQLGLFGEVPAKLSIKSTMEFAERNIIGKSFFVKALGEDVFFTKSKLKKAMNHPRGSKENLALVYKLPMMLEKAVLFTEQPDKKKRTDIKKVFKLLLIEELFGDIYRVLITVRKQDKNYYYDHSIIDKIKPEKQDGSVNNVNPIPLDVASPVPNKDKKKKGNGLKSPVVMPMETVAPKRTAPTVPAVATVQHVPVDVVALGAEKALSNPVAVPPLKESNPRVQNLSDSMQARSNNEIIVIPGDIGRFLGQVEKKPVHSVVITLDAEQGSGKTRFFFQAMNVLAGQGKKCLFYSLEEHPQSKLFKDKVEQYIDPVNLANISVVDEVVSWKDEESLIQENDMIFIDSFQKLPEMDLDADIRKAFNGKLFFIIYQQTGTKTMRGGAKAAFDGDIILKVQKHEDYRENYIYANKNRYNDAPELKFNIYTGALVNDAGSEPETGQPANSRIPPDETGGRLRATPFF